MGRLFYYFLLYPISLKWELNELPKRRVCETYSIIWPMWKYWYKESTSVEKHSLAKFHAHNYRVVEYTITHSVCCSVRPSICSCWGLPTVLAAPRYGTVSCFMTSLNVGGCGMGSWGDQLPYWSRGSECHGDNKLASLATRGSNCRSWYSIRPPQPPPHTPG